MTIINSSIFLLLFFLSMTTRTLSQDARLDSLENELSIHTESDTVRVMILNSITWSYMHHDIDKARAVNKEAEDLSDKLNFSSGKAKALYSKAQIALRISNYVDAISSAEQAFLEFKNLNNKTGMSYSLGCIGNAYYELGDFSKSMTYYERSASIDRERQDLNGVAANLNNIGNIYSDQGQYKKAIYHYTQARIIRQEMKDSVGASMAYNNIGLIYAEQSNFPKAMAQFKLAISTCNCPENKDRTASSLNSMAFIYKSQGKYDKALETYAKALDLYQQQDDQSQMAETINYIGNVHSQQSSHKKALTLYRQALDIYITIDNKVGMASSFTLIAESQLILGQESEALINYQRAIDLRKETDMTTVGQSTCYLGVAEIYTKQKKYDRALEYVQKSTNISKKQALIEHQKDAHELLSIIYENTGNYKQALINHQQYKLLNDSIFNRENIEKLAQIEYEYKYKQELEAASNRELKLTQKVKTTNKNLERSQRNYLLAIIAFLLITILSGAIIFYLKLRNAKSKHQNIVIEQKLLRSQMTPHFIFNSLSVLQGMILNNESKKSVTYLSKFSKLLRITLENSRDKMVSLDQEFCAIENYLLLQELEENKPSEYHIRIEKNIDKSIFRIPPMLIQPFIENSLEHAFVDQTENKKIDIHLTYTNQELICTVKDNGIGIDAQEKHNKKLKKSLATTITSERLKILSKDFKIKGSVTIEDRQKYKEQGTIVTLVIPYTIES